jgi:hypothetical protein
VNGLIIGTARTAKRQHYCLYFTFWTHADEGDFDLTIGIMYTNFLAILAPL